ncbi:tyrosine-type recombinase/integrase [Mycolicibacterium xanthum]|uniref:tyrosine-type recombinase/integrase n=1 Tax=Mycolicibacterium xanthum TaxID=2796469 RepID=UPI0021035079|nr:tyrosine-type recombinase/integrase [Mycolicibacterium xanthum]
MGSLVWSTPKTHERRSVPFPATLADEQSALMVGKGREDLVFTDSRGGVLRNSNWRARVFDPAVMKCQKADPKFPSITPHDLRHSAASLAVSAGANVKAVQRMLGHATASMTLDTYADLFDEDFGRSRGSSRRGHSSCCGRTAHGAGGLTTSNLHELLELCGAKGNRTRYRNGADQRKCGN